MDGLGRRVLLVVEDVTLEEILADALTAAGHAVELASPESIEGGEVSCTGLDVAIVDLDTRERGGASAVSHLQRIAPQVGVIAIVPCGALRSDYVGFKCQFLLEKPARIHAVLAAVQAATQPT
jgi:DNA-binding response OmpR family regulator